MCSGTGKRRDRGTVQAPLVLSFGYARNLQMTCTKSLPPKDTGESSGYGLADSVLLPTLVCFPEKEHPTLIVKANNVKSTLPKEKVGTDEEIVLYPIRWTGRDD